MVTIAEAGEVSMYRVLFEASEPEAVEQKPGRDLNRPESVAIVMDTYTVVVTAETGHVHLLDEEMEHVRSLSVPSWVTGSDLFQPVDAAANDIGEIFVLDHHAQRIYHFNANGSYLMHVDLSALQGPSAISYAAESLFVADREQGRVFVLTESGHELASIGTFPNLNRVRVYEELIWILSGSVVHLFDMYGEHTGNWEMEAADEPLQDIAVIDGQVFLLTSSSLYYLGSLQ